MISLIIIILFAGLYSWLFSLISLGPLFWILWIFLGILCSIIGFALSVLFVVYVPFAHGESIVVWREKYLRDVLTLGLIIFNIHYTYEGKENIPNETFVSMGNHKDPWDIILVYCVYDKPVSAVAKDDLAKIGLLNKLFKQFHVVCINRSNNREGVKALLEGIKYVKKGVSYVIFPEGGVKSRETEKCVGLKPGALKLATKPGVPISPFTITGSSKIQARGKNIFKRINIHVKIHPAVPVSYYEGKNTTEIGLYVESIIDSGVPDEK